MASVEEVKRHIRSAFSEDPIPAPIIDVVVWDKEMRRAMGAALEGRRWGDIPREVLRLHHDALGFLSPVGVRYLLPAFMVAALESPSSPILDTVVGILTRPQNTQDEQVFLETGALLTAPQRAAVCAFLEFLRDEKSEDWPDDQPGKALREYWAPTDPK